MHMDRVQITMKHTEESIKRLAKVQYDTFSVHTKVIWYGICLICILMGFGLIIDIGTPWRYIPLAFGCVAFANIGASSKARASNTLDAVRRQGGFPCTTMTFLNNKIRISEQTGGSADLEYNSLFRHPVNSMVCISFCITFSVITHSIFKQPEHHVIPV